MLVSEPPPLVNPVTLTSSPKLFTRVIVVVPLLYVPPVIVVNPDILTVLPEFEFKAKVPKLSYVTVPPVTCQSVPQNTLHLAASLLGAS
jgi:hypothetical protein